MPHLWEGGPGEGWVIWRQRVPSETYLEREGEGVKKDARQSFLGKMELEIG